MHGYAVIARALYTGGVRKFFGVMGGGSLEVVAHLIEELNADYLSARHENGAISMADGYSRATGEISVCALTKGPGLTNAVTALTTAARARTPLVIVVGDTPTWGGRHFQEIAQADVVAPTGAGFQPVRAPETVHEDTLLALTRAVGERRPIVLNAPADILAAECGDPAQPERVAVQPPAPVSPQPESVVALAQGLSAADRPLILAGYGAVRAGAKDALLALRVEVGGMCATTLRGKGIFERDRHDLGVIGGFERDASREALRAADCIVGFGASMNRLSLKNASAARLVHCDDDPEAFGSFLDSDLTVLGDARLVAEEATELLRRQREGRGDREGQWHGVAMPWDEPRETERPRLNEIMRACDEALPPDRNVVVDVGHFMGWPVQDLSVPDGRSFVCSGDFGAIGLGVGTAVGVATARPDRVTCAVVGDGGWFMGLPDLDTAVRYKLRIVFLVLDDGAYGSEIYQLERLGYEPSIAFFGGSDVEKAAAGLGAETMTIGTPADCRALADRIRNLRGPLVVRVPVDRDREATWHRSFDGFKGAPAVEGSLTV